MWWPTRLALPWAPRAALRRTFRVGPPSQWVVHRAPVAHQPAMAESSDTLQTFSFRFRRPPALAARAAFHSSFRKFRIGVDTVGLPSPSPPADPVSIQMGARAPLDISRADATSGRLRSLYASVFGGRRQATGRARHPSGEGADGTPAYSVPYPDATGRRLEYCKFEVMPELLELV